MAIPVNRHKMSDRKIRLWARALRHASGLMLAAILALLVQGTGGGSSVDHNGPSRSSGDNESRPAYDADPRIAHPVTDYFPPPDSEGGWRILSTAEDVRRVAGMDKKALDEAFEIAEDSSKNGGLLIVRNGWLVYERYFGKGHREATPNLASCGKSFTSIAVGILMAERPDLFPEGLDQKIFSPVYLPPEAFPLSDPAKADIRLGQLLAFSAGIRGNNPCYVNGKEVTIDPAGPDGYQAMIDAVAVGRKEAVNKGRRISAATLWCKPGGGYSYASASAHIASMLIRHVAGMELEEYLRMRLAQPMGWGRFGFGYRQAAEITHTPGAGGIAMRATDMMRFGYMLLRQGRWKDRQLVPAEYVRQCSRKSPYNSHHPYSLQFDVNTDGQIPEYPRDAYWKRGSGGHVFCIIPSLDLVVWELAGRDDQYDPANTGLPTHPDAARTSESRRDWRPTMKEWVGQRQVLRKVIESIVDPGRLEQRPG
jgi:CubicO group peptidase (beta-lactamase class C family)